MLTKTIHKFINESDRAQRMILIGSDLRDGKDVYVDSSLTSNIAVFGKRDAERIATLAVLAEELVGIEETTVIIIDPLGRFPAMAYPNPASLWPLYQWGMKPHGMPINLILPGNAGLYFDGDSDMIQNILLDHNIKLTSFQINPSDLTPAEWCQFFDVNVKSKEGVSLYKVVQNLIRTKNNTFSLDDMRVEAASDGKASDRIKGLLVNYIDWAISTGYFSNLQKDVTEVFCQGRINILCLSTLVPGEYDSRNALISAAVKGIFNKSVKTKIKEDLHFGVRSDSVWLIIDEAQYFLSKTSNTLLKDYLLHWMREGDEKNLSLIVSTHNPTMLEKEVIAQSDLLVFHRMSSLKEMNCFQTSRQSYMDRTLKDYINELSEVGQAVMINDLAETVSRISIRPPKSRMGMEKYKSTWHDMKERRKAINE